MISQLVMSHTFTLQGNSNVLSDNYYPPIELCPHKQYCIGLIGFHSYHTIPNIEEGADKFICDKQVFTLPSGAYELSDISLYLQQQLCTSQEADCDKTISIKANNNTLKCELKSKYDIDFSPENTIGKLLGFSRRLLIKDTLHESDLPVEIVKVSSIRVECNIATGSYYKSNLSHTLYEFAPSVDPGYAINVEPRNILYLPINTHTISNIILRILDQDNKPVNFRGEKITVRLELKTIQ